MSKKKLKKKLKLYKGYLSNVQWALDMKSRRVECLKAKVLVLQGLI